MPWEPPVMTIVCLQCQLGSRVSKQSEREYPAIDFEMVLATEEAHDVQRQHRQKHAKADSCPEQADRHCVSTFS